MPSLFISYRRADSPDTVKLIHERLTERLPRWDIFYDHDSIPLGEQFPDRLRAKVISATVVLVIVGPKWLDVLRERRTAPVDHVRVEIRLALEAGASVVPVLVGNAGMPTDADLADFPDLLPLLQRNGRPIRPDPDFDHDFDVILTHLELFDATLLGKYRLTGEIGFGGMGVVYRATQTQPVERTVAIKQIKPGMGSPDDLVRFNIERQALAAMDHPNIAKVLDAGRSANGMPFFVMEYVKGVPITQYCDDKKLTPKERIDLFIPVCNAVQHAHNKGIIHRDIKPSNVLVEIVDGKPVPKVIDFGLAKALGKHLTDDGSLTVPGTRVGTLVYSSPEQAAGRLSDVVDTGTDIYSLGVLLYELLAGAPPFTREELLRIGEEAMLRAIREDEPPKPSAKLSSSGELPAIAARRKLEPRKLTGMVQGDLDWIVMKCLEKDRARRYETANQVGQELHRFLADEPVQAGPPSVAYRLQKFLRRNRGSVIAAAVVIMAMVAGIVGTSIGLVQADAANTKERETSRQLAKERDHARGETIRAEKEWKRAERETKLAQDNENSAEWRLYAFQIASAQREWETTDLAQAYRFLGLCRPDFRGWEHDYLYTLFNLNQRTLRGNALGVTRVEFSPDGKYVISSGSGAVKLWEVATARQLFSFSEGIGIYSPDGTKVACVSPKGIEIWDTAIRKAIKTIAPGQQLGRAAAFSADSKRIVTAGDKLIRVWDIATGEAVQTLRGQETFMSVACSRDGKKIVSGSYEKNIMVWNAASGDLAATLKGHTHAVTSVAFGLDSTKIVSGSFDGTIKVWDLVPGREPLTLYAHSGGVMSVAFSHDDKKIVSGGSETKAFVPVPYQPKPATLKVWDVAAGRELLMLKGHLSTVTSVAFSSDDSTIASGSDDFTVKLWDMTKVQQSMPLMRQRSFVESIAFSPDGNKIASSNWDSDGQVKVWDTETGQELLRMVGLGNVVRSVAWSPDGQWIVSGGDDRIVTIWNAIGGKKVRDLKGHSDRVNSVAWSPDSKKIVSGSSDGTVKVWDAATGKENLILRGGLVTFSSDGRKIATVGSGSLKVWNAADGKELLSVGGNFTCVTFSPDGSSVVVGLGKSLKLWDATSGELLQTLGQHEDSITSVAFHPDGSRIVSAGMRFDRTLKVWNPKSGQETITLKGHGDSVTCVAFSPNGKRIASSSLDTTVRVWQASQFMPPERK